MTTETGRPKWRTVPVIHGDRRLVVTALVPLHPAVFPLFDLHQAVMLAYPAPPDGLPGEDVAAALWELTFDVENAVGERAAVVGLEMHTGVASLHVYSDVLDPVTELLQTWAASWPYPHEVQTTEDPAWEETGHLRLERLV